MPRILHLFAAFDEADPAAARTAPLIDALGARAAHAVVSDDRDRRSAAHMIGKSIAVSWPRFPPLTGSKLPGRLMKLAGAMAGYDLICTYSAGALDAALAHTLFADVHHLAPLVHHEFDPAEAGGRSRAWYRRVALGRSAALIVPTRALEAVALEDWDQPRARVRLIPDGIDTGAFAAAAKPDALPGLIKRKGESWLGTFAEALEPEPAGLLAALERMPPGWQLVIVGESAARASLEAEAARLKIEDRLHWLPANVERRVLFGLLDALVLPTVPDLPAGPETLAGRIIEAMAAGLALVAPRDGAADPLVSSANGPLLYQPGDPQNQAQGLSQALALVARADERRRIGLANRDRARAEFDEHRRAERCWALYGGLIGRAQAGSVTPEA